MFKPPVYSHSVILPCIRVIVSRCLGPVDDLTERPPHADHGGHPLIPKKEAVDAFEKVILSHHPLNPHTSKKSKGELYELGNQIITDLEGETNDWNMVWSTNTTGAIRLLFDHYYWGSGKKPVLGIDIRNHTSAAIPAKQCAVKQALLTCGRNIGGKGGTWSVSDSDIDASTNDTLDEVPIFYFSTIGDVPLGGVLSQSPSYLFQDPESYKSLLEKSENYMFRPAVVLSLRNYMPGTPGLLEQLFDGSKFSRRPLLVIPSTSNLDGATVNLVTLKEFLGKWKEKGIYWRVLIDGAKSFGDGNLNLRELRDVADYITFSMYKQCGMSTGVGCLLIRSKSESIEPLISGLHDPRYRPNYGGGGVTTWDPCGLSVLPSNDISLRMSTGTPPIMSILHQIEMMKAFRKIEKDKGTTNYHQANSLAKMLIFNLPSGVLCVNCHPSMWSVFRGTTVLLTMLHPSYNDTLVCYEHLDATISQDHGLWRSGPCCNYGGFYSVLNGKRHNFTDEDECEGGFFKCSQSKVTDYGGMPAVFRVSFGLLNRPRDVEAVINKLSSLMDTLRAPVMRINEIMTYPVKGAQNGIKIMKKVELKSGKGIDFDRLFQLTDMEGSTQMSAQFELYPEFLNQYFIALKPSRTEYNPKNYYLILPILSKTIHLALNKDVNRPENWIELGDFVEEYDGDYVWYSSTQSLQRLNWLCQRFIIHRLKESPIHDISIVETEQLNTIKNLWECHINGMDDITNSQKQFRNDEAVNLNHQNIDRSDVVMNGSRFKANITVEHLNLTTTRDRKKDKSLLNLHSIVRDGSLLYNENCTITDLTPIARCSKIDSKIDKGLSHSENESLFHWLKARMKNEYSINNIYIGMRSGNNDGYIKVGDIFRERRLESTI